MFVVFEGLDGVGKTTQIALVAERLRSLGNSVMTTYEPGGTPFGDELRAILRSYSGLHVRTQVLLYNAARAELVEREIRPALRRGDIVLCDRYAWSTYAYQIALGDLKDESVDDLSSPIQYAVGKVMPELVFLLNCGFDVLRKRRGEGNWLDNQPVRIKERIRSAYLRFAEQDKRFTVIDASLSVGEITEQIFTKILQAGL